MNDNRMNKLNEIVDHIKNDNKSSSSGGIGFAGLLAILFICLKLTGYISWSWWWVLSPLWIPFVVVLLIVGVIFGIVLLSN